jgi:hypothetical protein
MRTSGHGRGDGWMSGVPIAILVVFGLIMGGGFTPTLRTMERFLWTAVDWVAELVS